MTFTTFRRAVTLVAAVATIATVTTTPLTAQGAPAPNWVGTWKGAFTTDGPSGTMTLTVGKESDAWKVANVLEGDGIPAPNGDPRDWKTDGTICTYAQTYGEYEVMFKGTLEGDVIKGTLEAYQGGSLVGTGSFELKKQ